MSHPLSSLGVLLAGVPADRVGEVARVAERLGFGSIWCPEDYPERPAAVMAALAIAATDRITVATGVASLATRHPVVVAMEAAALAEAAPGRTLAGVGLGLPATLEPLGCLPERPVAFVRRRAAAVRELLAGRTVDLDDPTGRLTATALAHPPSAPPPMVLGGLGPRMLGLAGEVADGVIVSSLGTDAYLRWTVEVVGDASARASRPMPRVTAFAWFHLADDDETGRAVMRPNVAGALGFVGPGPLTDADGWSDDLAALRDGDRALADTIPDGWVSEMVVAGSAASCASGISRRLAAGADEVVVCPMGADPIAQLERIAAEVAPIIGR